MRAKRDYPSVETSENKLDKTEKLLAIDYLLGGPGNLNELINKLCQDRNNCLTKKSVYKVLGEILATSPDNIKKDIIYGVKDIRIGNRLSSKRIDQLKTIKEIFSHANLKLKAGEVGKLIIENK